MKAFEYLTTQAWAVRPDVLEAGIAIALREQPTGFEALRSKEGREPDDAEAMQVRDGVAIIPIKGPIFRYSSLFTRLCGGTTTEAIAKSSQPTPSVGWPAPNCAASCTPASPAISPLKV